MAKSNMDQDILKILLSEEEIKARVQELGDQLYDAFHDKNPLFVGVLKGCFIFMADLVRAAQLKSELEFIGVSSYQNGTKSSGVVQITATYRRISTGGMSSSWRTFWIPATRWSFEEIPHGQGCGIRHHRHPAG